MAFGFPPKFVQVNKYPHDKDHLYAVVQLVLSEFNWTILENEDYFIEAKTNRSTFGIGEMILIDIRDQLVAIKSQCFIFSQFVDFGMNKKNVIEFFEMLDQHPEIKTPVQPKA